MHIGYEFMIGLKLINISKMGPWWPYAIFGDICYHNGLKCI